MSQAPQITSKDREALALQKIRPELNLEKWTVWQPAKSKNAPRARTMKREVALADGSRITAKVKIGFTDEGALTTEDQKTYYALIQHWEEQGGAENPIAFSLQRLAKRLNKKWGTNVIEALTASLIRLRTTPFIWENSYFDRSSQETLELLTAFNILQDLKIAKRKKDGVITKEAGYFRFNDFILHNLLTNHTKPVLFDVVLSFKSEIAQLLYTHIDLMLADKPIYERRTIELLEDLCISGAEYKKPSVRKRTLEKALLELQQVPLSKGGIVASATIERTKDEKDYKVVFRKGSARKIQDATPTDLPEQDKREVEDIPPAASYTSKQITLADQKAQELVTHFYKLFHNIQTHAPTSKERAQAAALIAQHGWNIAIYIVDYAYREAPKTEYQPKTFGGIMHYTTHALGDYEARRREQELEATRRAEEAAKRMQERAQQESENRARARYNQLTESERQSLTETYAARLCAENPMWAEAKEKGTVSLLNAAVRAAIIEDFTRQELGYQGGEATANPTPV